MQIKIEKLIYEGWGIGRDENGAAIFVKKSVPGDVLEVKIVKDKKKFKEAVIQKIISPSPDRIAPLCPHFDLCGGCDHQNISYENQLKYKAEIFAETLGRAGVETKILPIIPGSDSPFYYRNSIRFFFIEKENGEKTFTRHNYIYDEGFVEANECFLQSETSNIILKTIKDLFNNSNVNIGSFYQVKIREGKQTGEFMVELITTDEDLALKKELVESLKKIDGVKSIYQTVTPGKTLRNTRRYLLFGSPIIFEKIGHFSFQISPDSFFQTNSLGVKTLYDTIKSFARVEAGDTILDLYCGTGSIGIYLSTLAKKVIGVEIVKSAVNDAVSNARINKVSNTEFICADASQWLALNSPPRLGLVPSDSRVEGARGGSNNSTFSTDPLDKLETSSRQATKLTLDPPRAGLSLETVSLILNSEFSNLIYVSCNPATFARDIAIFQKNGWKLVKVQPIDMFPQTHHIECVGMLVKI